jgi:hypothetical protein
MTPLRKPRLELIHLVVLAALAVVVFMILNGFPWPLIAAMIAITAFLIFQSDRATLMNLFLIGRNAFEAERTSDHKRRFKLIHLADLGAVVGIVLALLPVPASLIWAGVIVVIAFLYFVTAPTTLIEWLVLAAIGAVLISLTMPAVPPHHPSRMRTSRQTNRSTTTAPATIPTK